MSACIMESGTTEYFIGGFAVQPPLGKRTDAIKDPMRSLEVNDFLIGKYLAVLQVFIFISSFNHITT